MDLRQEVEAAAERISGRALRTPVVRAPELESGGGRVWLKLETRQRTGSFKLRGALNRVLSLSAAERRRGVVAASSGNHGAAVARAGAEAGCQVLVFVPEGVPEPKLAAIRSHGAEVRVRGDDALVAEVEARRHAAAEGQTYISPYNDPLVVAGQGTLGLELDAQLERLDAVFLALGGGGLLAGVGGYLKAVRPEVRVIACSPSASPVMHASLEAGHIVELAARPTLSDATAGGVEPGAITFELCRRLVDESLLVDETEIRDAIRLVARGHDIPIEGAAGVAVAGYLTDRERFAALDVAIVLCGGNIDPATLAALLGDPEARDGRRR